MKNVQPQKRLVQIVPGGAVRLYGRKGSFIEKFSEVTDIARNIGGRRLQAFVPPVTPDDPGRHRIITEFTNTIERAEGCVLEHSGDVAATTTRDCHTVTISYGGRLGLAHVGRDSMMPHCSRSVIHELMRELKVLDGSKVNVFISGGISSKYFTHEDTDRLRPLLELYGSDIVADDAGSLDMVRVIKNCLTNFGVESKNITHDGNCTSRDDWLGSRRAGKAGSNWTFLIKK